MPKIGLDLTKQGIENAVNYVNDNETNIDNAIDITNGASATGNRSTALGVDSVASGDGSIAIGSQSEAEGVADIAIGSGAHADNGGTALGVNAEADGNAALSVGDDSSATGYQSMAIGHTAVASAQHSVAVGHGARATGIEAVQIGEGQNPTQGTVNIKNTRILDATGKIPFSALQGGEVVGLAVNSNNHLIVTYANGTTADLGTIGGGGTSDYTDLTNKPKINGVELSGNKTSALLGLQSELVSGTNIKTINNLSILGNGNIDIQEGIVKPLPAEAYQCTTPQQFLQVVTDGWWLAEQYFTLTVDEGGTVGIPENSMIYVLLFSGDACDICVYSSFISYIYVSRDGSEATAFITSDIVDKLLAEKQNKLTFDTTPRTGSTNPVTSAGIKTYVDTAVGDIGTALIGLISGGGVV